MVKFVIFCTKVILIAITTLLFASCGNNVFDGIKGNGNVQTEKRTLTDKFTKVEVSRGLEVILEQGDQVLVEVEADQNLLKHITTKVENGTLLVSSDENIYSAEKEIVRIKMPIIEGLSTTSGSNIKSKNSLKGTTISVSSTSGSEIQADLEYDSISTETSSGSNITIAGKALKLKTNASSGSEINANDLLANEIISQATSGSSIEVHPLLNLVAKSSSGASINYSGTPKVITKEETSGGSVSSN
ncbi:head GIN domain-containing protein [Flavobacterium sp. SUN052]|uniref:head GIN domain-containing protein n=1 Tax=Flavobacterium sp. SUN052 TaxID=3002441 RepID=UPI00237DD872|nr:head GIN domain-containing protein [Flavobacterium sp. SUN052]MEC4003963.1 head GIN domain-containing protein [Flavobacterium sp. SUN052]